MYLIFDTETTGFFKQIKPDPSDPANYPHVIQLGFILMDAHFEVVQTYCELIQPDGWKIPNECFWIENGYTTEKSKKYGIPIEEALTAFCKAVDRCNTLIAHNMKFDHPIMTAEMKRHNIMPKKKTGSQNLHNGRIKAILQNTKQKRHRHQIPKVDGIAHGVV